MKQPKLYNLFRFFVKYDNNFTIQSRIQVFYGAYALLIEYLNGSDEKWHVEGNSEEKNIWSLSMCHI